MWYENLEWGTPEGMGELLSFDISCTTQTPGFMEESGQASQLLQC